MKLIDSSDIIYLSKYQDGDNIEKGFAKYIYNGTTSPIIISITFGIEEIIQLKFRLALFSDLIG